MSVKQWIEEKKERLEEVPIEALRYMCFRAGMDNKENQNIFSNCPEVDACFHYKKYLKCFLDKCFHNLEQLPATCFEKREYYIGKMTSISPLIAGEEGLIIENIKKSMEKESNGELWYNNALND